MSETPAEQIREFAKELRILAGRVLGGQDTPTWLAAGIRSVATELCGIADALKARPVVGAFDYDRVRETVAECAGLSDHQIDLCAAYMRFAHASGKDKAAVDCAIHGRRSEVGILHAIDGCRVAPESESAPRRDHIEAAESWLATCQGDASQWSTVQAVSTQAGAHALVDIAESLRGLREDLQALTATVRDAADTGVRMVGD